ncbi:MAG: methyltransferase domain-containing protein [Bryobacteraceae bacterium]|jgi:SAM-dependent methyltransferase
MKDAVLQLLACPRCHAAFEAVPDNGDGAEILEGKLNCTGCRTSFPIRRGVPRFLPEKLDPAKRATADAFGYEWTNYFQLTPADRLEFLDWIRPLTADDFVDRVVLDGGCGKGRHIYLASQFGARQVVGIDLSDAVESAFQNTRRLPNVHVIQADIFNLPFASPFDLVYSIGVLHHLPDPKQGFLSLAGHVRPGGRISIWVYGKEGNDWIANYVDPVRINITSRMPKLATRALSFVLSLPLYAALKLVYGPAQRIPRLARLKSWLPYAPYLCAISNYSFAENFWNVFDHLVAPTAFYHSRDEVEDWFATAGLNEGAISRRNNNSWRGTGLMPPKRRL